MQAGERDLALEAWLRERLDLVPAWPAGARAVAEGAHDPVSASVRQEVLTTIQAYYAALSDRDWRAFAEHFWPGATLSTIWQPPGETMERVTAVSVPEFVERAPEGPGSREIFEERMLDARIRLEGELAQVWARYEARFGDPGDIAEWQGVDAFTLLRHDGRWRIVSVAYARAE